VIQRHGSVSSPHQQLLPVPAARFEAVTILCMSVEWGTHTLFLAQWRTSCMLFSSVMLCDCARAGRHLVARLNAICLFVCLSVCLSARAGGHLVAHLNAVCLSGSQLVQAGTWWLG
jgi:hypothetical protein